MAILLNPFNRIDEWEAALSRHLPDEEFVRWPDVKDRNAIDFIVAWVMPRAEMATFGNLQAVLNLGAGTEQWQKDGMPKVPIVRLVDPEMSNEMASYALHWVTHYQRRFDIAEANQAAGIWEQPDYVQAGNFAVGILGYGTIGYRVGEVFRSLGYQVNSWRRSDSDPDDVHVTHYVDLDELDDFLGDSDAVVNVLPSTKDTTGLLNAQRFAAFKPGAVLVNMGRGTVLEEAALVDAVASGQLRAAVLDVTEPEPPAADSPLWTQSGIRLTSHVAGSTQVKSAAKLVAANIKRLRAGEKAFPMLDRDRGY